MSYCASLDRAATFVYYDDAGGRKQHRLKASEIITIYGVNQFGVSARAKTPEGCQDGIFYDTGFYSKEPNCDGCPCPDPY